MDKAALYRRRRAVNVMYLGISMLAVLFGLFWLVWILWTLFAQGLQALDLSLFTQTTPPPGSKGGLANAIFGSLLMSLLATLIGTPVGILAGTYVAEYGRRGWLAPVTRFINDILLSAPSIVIGLFVYAVYVANVQHFSGWAGTFALALIVIPVVLKTTENMLRLVPDTMREAAAALGADVISSSLIYIDWYQYQDMDGDTAPITIAADVAAVPPSRRPQPPSGAGRYGFPGSGNLQYGLRV